MGKRIAYIYYFLLTIIAFGLPKIGHCQTPADSIDTEKDSFVTVSFLVASPLPAIYSVFGHATLRLECPDYKLDYVFTFESDTNVDAFMTGVAGKAKAKFVAVPTQKYLADAKSQGREVKQYTINLTLNERKRLWQLLDNQMVAGAYRKFNMFYTNCVSTSVNEIQHCLIDEHLEWGPKDPFFELCDGDFFRHATRNAPWAEFVFVSFMGNSYGNHSDIKTQLSPENVIGVLRKALFVNDVTGESRPVVTDKGKVVVKGTMMPENSWFTPFVCFLLLLLLTVAITLAQWFFKLDKVGVIYDFILFAAQTLIGLLMLYMTFASNLFPISWNWYLIPFFPVPLVLYFLKKNKYIANCWIAYSIVLLLFILATPLIGALDLPHQFITASLLVRCIHKSLIIKKNISFN